VIPVVYSFLDRKQFDAAPEGQAEAAR